ncbi:MAG: hypothetical protein QG635_1414, partial [Bacteroidota bacterium]|nr:hypothetical protein [Bacteroidota bacterium]
LSIFAVILVVGISSCKRGNNPVDSGDIFDQPLYQLVDPQTNTMPSDIAEASLDNDIALQPYDLESCGGFGTTDGKNTDPTRDKMKKPPVRNIKFIPLGVILRQLKLTDDQKPQILEFLREHRDCVKEARQALMESERPIIQRANEERKAIAEAVRSGRIDKREAMKMLQELNQRVRQALQDNPVRAKVEAMVKRCFCQLFANIRTVLTEEQLPLFDRWVAAYHKYCLVDTRE